MARDMTRYIERRFGSLHLFERTDVIAARVRTDMVPAKPGAKTVQAPWTTVPTTHPRHEGLDVGRVAEFEDGREVVLVNMLTMVLKEGSPQEPHQVAELVEAYDLEVARKLFGRAYSVRRKVPRHELIDSFALAAQLGGNPAVESAEPVYLEALGPRETSDGAPR